MRSAGPAREALAQKGECDTRKILLANIANIAHNTNISNIDRMGSSKQTKSNQREDRKVLMQVRISDVCRKAIGVKAARCRLQLGQAVEAAIALWAKSELTDQAFAAVAQHNRRGG